MTTARSSQAIRWVAAFEGTKGLIVLLAATGLLALIHRDVAALAASLVEHTHLNPASKYPKIFLDAAARSTDTKLLQLAAGAAAYAGFRLTQAYGLLRQRAWAEVVSALSGGIYVPFEIMALMHKPSALAATLLVINVAVVALMIHALRQRRHALNRVT